MALAGDFADVGELVGICDLNQTRMNFYNAELQQTCGHRPVPTYRAADFDRMIREQQPDAVIVTTIDRLHHRYICRAMELGCDAVTEKPLTIDAEKCQQIVDTVKRTGKNLTVTFNYRYSPRATKVKEVLKAGTLGDILSVHFEWLLDTNHGADYFRRWHRDKRNSGGLMVHKATHHFDLVNWFLEDEPARVSAFGDLLVYGRNGPVRGERCTTCPHYANGCRFAMVTHLDPETQSTYDNLYWNAESADGYLRDRCVYRPEIDIYDTMSAIVKYRGGAQLAYSLNAYSATEGYVLALVGTEGRLEARESHGGLNMRSEGDANTFCIITGGKRSNMKVEEIAVPIDHTNHGGGDSRLYRHLFAGDLDDPLNQMAGSRDGAMSCLIGIAANKSIAEGRPVAIADLLAEPVAANA